MDMLKTAVGKSQGIVNLRIIRKKAGFLGMYPIYYLFDDTQSVFFLNSKKMTRNKTSNYLISWEKDVFNKDHDSYVGKLRSNNDKSKYLLYDNGESIEKNKAAGIDKIRCELAYVAYNIEKVNINGTRNVMVALPKLDEEYHPMVFRQLKKEDSICYHYADGKKENLYTFENAMPYWKNNKYVLNFSERIKKSSVKNLQIIRTRKTKDGESKTDIVLEFGKVSSNEFSLTLKYPFSIMNAFAVALSSFDK